MNETKTIYITPEDDIEQTLETLCGKSEGVSVHLKKGIYRLNKALRITEKLSGLTLIGDDGAIIDGSCPVTQWQKFKDGIYSVDFDEDIHSLYEDNDTAQVARYPKTGYLKVSSQPSKIENGQEPVTNSFCCSESNVIEMCGSKTECFMFPGGPFGEWNWFSHIYPIVSTDKERNVISLDRSSYADNAYYIGAGSRYYLRNSLSLLTQPGEFCLDKENKKLYYKPLDEKNLYNGKITVSCIETPIEIVGDSSCAENITIKNLTIRNSDIKSYSEFRGALIKASNTSGLSVNNCRLYNGGKYGILAIDFNRHICIKDCEIYSVGETAIQLNGNNDKLSSFGHIIENNYIHDTGLLLKHGAGIQLYSNRNTVISHNTVKNTPRYSISIKGYPLKDANSKTIADSPYDKNLVVSGANSIMYNNCSNANTDTQDTGVIECWASGDGNRIIGNFIHDSYIRFSFGAGIYIDDFNTNTLISGNVLYNLRGMESGTLIAAVFAKLRGNKITDNIIACCTADCAFLLPDFKGASASEEITDTVVERNILYNCINVNALGVASTVFLDFRKHLADKHSLRKDFGQYLTTCNYNVFFADTTGMNVKKHIYKNHVDGFTKRLKQWMRVSGYDNDSLIIDPKFKNITGNDFTVCNKTVSEQLKIKGINAENIGCHI